MRVSHKNHSQIGPGGLTGEPGPELKWEGDIDDGYQYLKCDRGRYDILKTGPVGHVVRQRNAK